VQLPSRELGAFLAAEMTLSENCDEDNGGGWSPFVATRRRVNGAKEACRTWHRIGAVKLQPGPWFRASPGTTDAQMGMATGVVQ
jgi:hypothetical protein